MKSSITKANKNFKQKGSLLIEIVIVTSIIVGSMIAALAVAQKSIYLSRESLNQSQAGFLLEEGAEATRIVRDDAWTNISSLTNSTEYYLNFSGGTWIFTTTPQSSGIFTRKVVFSSAYRDANDNLAGSGTLDAQTRLVTVTVSWLEGTDTISKSGQFYLADIFSS